MVDHIIGNDEVADELVELAFKIEISLRAAAEFGIEQISQKIPFAVSDFKRAHHGIVEIVEHVAETEIDRHLVAAQRDIAVERGAPTVESGMVMPSQDGGGDRLGVGQRLGGGAGKG